jgi:hypothetical protein
VDQIFDRLGKLIQAWISSTFDESLGSANYRDAGVFEDQDLADAWDELESFLDPSKTDTERKENFHARESQNFRNDTERKAIEDAYRFLDLPPYAPFREVKFRYKELLKKHHPDRHASSPEEMKNATAISAKINAAYQLIEAWEESVAAARK